MVEYIKREAAIEAAIDASDEWDGGYNLSRAAIIRNAINTIPAADVVPAEKYVSVVEQMNALADKLIKIREIAGCRNV